MVRNKVKDIYLWCRNVCLEYKEYRKQVRKSKKNRIVRGDLERGVEDFGSKNRVGGKKHSLRYYAGVHMANSRSKYFRTED